MAIPVTTRRMLILRRNSQLQVAVAGFVFEDTISFDVHVFKLFAVELHNSEVKYIVLSGFDGAHKKARVASIVLGCSATKNKRKETR